MKRKKFTPPKDFDLLELECDERNLIQFQMLGKVLKRQEKDIERQTIALGRRLFLGVHGKYLVSIDQAKAIAANYRKEVR